MQDTVCSIVLLILVSKMIYKLVTVVVAYLMITMNYLSALELNRNNADCSRNVEESEESVDIPSEIPIKVRKFIKNFRSSRRKMPVVK